MVAKQRFDFRKKRNLGIILIILLGLSYNIFRDAMDKNKPSRRNISSIANARYKILFLSDQYTYLNFMDRSFYFQFDAAREHPRVDEAILWGLGLPGYQANSTLLDNIMKRFGSIDYFDAIFLFGSMIKNDEVAELTKVGVLSSIRQFECFDNLCRPFVLSNNCSVYQTSYMIDMHQYKDLSFDRVIIHSPHCADADTFQGRLVGKENKAVLVGAISDAYPLRKRWKQLIDTGKLDAVHLKHPGYWQEDPNGYPSAWSSHHDALLKRADQQVSTYAETLKKYSICLMDASVYKYALMKYVEAMMAGCLIVADLPDDNPDFFSRHVIKVDIDMSDGDLLDTIKYWQNHHHERFKKITEAQKEVLQKYTWVNSIDTMLHGFDLFRKGKFGMYYSAGYIQSCSALNALTGHYQNQWCPGMATPVSN